MVRLYIDSTQIRKEAGLDGLALRNYPLLPWALAGQLQQCCTQFSQRYSLRLSLCRYLTAISLLWIWLWEEEAGGARSCPLPPTLTLISPSQCRMKCHTKWSPDALCNFRLHSTYLPGNFRSWISATSVVSTNPLPSAGHTSGLLHKWLYIYRGCHM